MLALPLAAYTGCSDEDSSDDTASGGAHAGRGGQGGRGGLSGHSGASGHGAIIGAAGESSGGTAGASDAEGGTGGGLGEAGEGGAAGAVALSDSEILKVMATANEAEIAAAQVAKPGAQTTSVSNYAQLMITDHTASNSALLALVSTKHIAPAESDLSMHLESEAAASLQTLSQTAPAAFDKTYIQSQVMMHQEVLTLLNDRLVPSAQDPDLKALLTTTQTTVTAHLQQATNIAAGL